MAKNWNPKYKINLLDVFKRAYASEPSELRNKLRPLLSNEGLKFLYGQLIIDEIVKNTLESTDRHGRKFSGGYSKAYRESLQFKIWKGGKRSINLKLTGDMLSDIKPTQTQYMLIFGLEEQDNRNKAQGHISGRYGARGRTAPRDFLGVPRGTEDDLLRKALKITMQSNFNVTADLFDDVVLAAVGVRGENAG